MCLGIFRVDEILGGRRENGNLICLWRTHERIVSHFYPSFRHLVFPHMHLPSARAVALAKDSFCVLSAHLIYFESGAYRFRMRQLKTRCLPCFKSASSKWQKQRSNNPMTCIFACHEA
jgi:hypothetical protein